MSHTNSLIRSGLTLVGFFKIVVEIKLTTHFHLVPKLNLRVLLHRHPNSVLGHRDFLLSFLSLY
jgi:hypothetical protein